MCYRSGKKFSNRKTKIDTQGESQRGKSHQRNKDGKVCNEPENQIVRHPSLQAERGRGRAKNKDGKVCNEPGKPKSTLRGRVKTLTAISKLHSKCYTITRDWEEITSLGYAKKLGLRIVSRFHETPDHQFNLIQKIGAIQLQ